MEDIRKNFINSLIDAEKSWQSADNLANIVFPVVNDPKLLVRALEGLFKSVVLIVSTIIKFEYVYGRMELSSDKGKNLDKFFTKCSFNYGLNDADCKVVREIMFLGKKHRESGFEFSKSGKLIILDDRQGVFELNLSKIREFLALTKKLLENTNRNFKDSF